MSATVYTDNSSQSVEGASVSQVNVRPGTILNLNVDGPLGTAKQYWQIRIPWGSGSVSTTQGGNVTGQTTGTNTSAGSGSQDTSNGNSSGGSSKDKDNHNSNGNNSNNNSGDNNSSNNTNLISGLLPSGNTLATPVNLAVYGLNVYWNPVADTTSYDVYAQNAETNNIVNLGSWNEPLPGFDLSISSLSTGHYNISVRALGTYSAYSQSDLSVGESVYVQRLDTPQNIKQSGDGQTISWSSVANANEYDVQIDPVTQNEDDQSVGSKVETVLTNSFLLKNASLPNGSYNISISARDSSDNYRSSVTSNPITLTINNSTTSTVYQVYVPQNIQLTGNIISWDPVTNATGYEVDWNIADDANSSYYGGGVGFNSDDPTLVNTNGKLSLDLLGDWIPIPSGNYNFTVTADASGQYTDSNPSSSVYGTISELQAPSNVQINGSTIT